VRYEDLLRRIFSNLLISQYCLGDEPHMVYKFLNGWLCRSICYGKKISNSFYLKSVLIVFH
jgi:hypothetical protein